jgi:hypothetical protein
MGRPGTIHEGSYRTSNIMAIRNSRAMSEPSQSHGVFRSKHALGGANDAGRDVSLNLSANRAEGVGGWLRPRWTRAATHAVTLVDGRFIVDRRSASRRIPIPSWLLRGVLTTVVIATIGFSLQGLLMQPSGSASGHTPAGNPGWTATGADAGAAGLDPMALAALAPEQQALRPISRQAAIALNDSIPFSMSPVLPAAPFVLGAANEQDRDRASGCLAQAIYYEAGGDTLDDQRAVAQVVLNRVRHPLFPKTVCGVVFQGSQLKTGCQFTFTCDGSMSRTPDARVWARAKVLATAALNGAVFAPVGYATHFHTPWVAPYWAPTLEKIVQVGGHLFYRWPGGAGAPRAFKIGYGGGEVTTASIGVPEGVAPTEAGTSVGPPAVPEPPDTQAQKNDFAPVELSAATPVVAYQAPLAAAPRFAALAATPSLAVRAYRPPVPRGGSAQPLLSRDR